MERVTAPAAAQPLLEIDADEHGAIAYIYDLAAHHFFVLPDRMLSCGRGGGFAFRGCENPSRYLLLRPDNGLGYGICEECIEDFDFWRERGRNPEDGFDPSKRFPEDVPR